MALYSVIIPTRGRPRQLGECLDAVSELDYPRNGFEVIVVNDGGEPPSRTVVAAASARFEVRFVAQRHAGPAAARNFGSRHARGDILAFTDDDCRPDRQWLRALAREFEAEPGAAVGGHIVNILTDNIYAATSQALIDYLYEYYGEAKSSSRFFTSNNLAVPRDRFHELGGFDTTFRLPAAEDRDFCERWSGRGWPLRYAPDAIVGHAHGLTLRKFWRQHFNYGRGAVDLQKARQRMRHDGPHLEPASFYTNLVRYPLARLSNGRASVMASLLLLSQVAYAAGYYSERAKRLSLGPR